MSEIQPPEYFLQFASTNLATSEYPQLGMAGHPARLGNFALEAGYDGVELHPAMLSRSTLLVNRAVNTGQLIVGSLCQSALGADRAVRDAPAPKPNLDERVQALKTAPQKYARRVGAHILRPNASASTEFIQEVQANMHRKVPAIMQPSTTMFEDRLNQRRTDAASYNIVPTDAAAQRWNMPLTHGSRATEAFVDEAQRRGFSFALDTIETRRRYVGFSETVSQLGHPRREERLQKIAQATTALRVSFCPPDMDDHAYFQARKELKYFLSEGAFTGGATADIINAVKEHGRIDRAVVDVRADMLSEALHGFGWSSFKKPKPNDVRAAYVELGRATRYALQEL